MTSAALFRSVRRGVEDNLARQFLLVAAGVLLVGMVAQGLWVTGKIEEGVTDVSAISTALYVNGFVAPYLQELGDRDALSPANAEALNAALRSGRVREHVTAINVWKRHGLIAYSSEPSLIGRRFTRNPNPGRAWSGDVVTVFDVPTKEEDAFEQDRGAHILEVYAPIRDFASGEVIAVLEFHERADGLSAELRQAQWHSWAVQGLITASVLAALYSIVADGSKTIDRQRTDLAARVRELSELLAQNETLRHKGERAAQNAAENLEQGVRRIGYDLHDGVAQLIGMALLRIDRVKPADRESGENVARIRSALEDALKDIRNLCKGLLLPEIQSLSFTDALRHMVRSHERGTGTFVDAAYGDLPAAVPDFVKASLCRFVQESLNNSYRHANGQGQKVRVDVEDDMVVLSVSDEGPGLSVPLDGDGVRFGLKGLRDRIESVGGRMSVETAPGRGTRLTAHLPLNRGGADER